MRPTDSSFLPPERSIGKVRTTLLICGRNLTLVCCYIILLSLLKCEYCSETAEEADSHEALEFDNEQYPWLPDNVLELRHLLRKAILQQYMVVMSSIARYSCIFAFLHRLRMITWSSHTPHMSHDLSRSLLTISDHFRSFPTISDDFYFRLTSSACWGSQFSTPAVQYTIAESIGMLGYQKREAASAYRFGPTLVWQFGDIVMVTQALIRPAMLYGQKTTTPTLL
jgi:hypothetical protein